MEKMMKGEVVKPFNRRDFLTLGAATALSGCSLFKEQLPEPDPAIEAAIDTLLKTGPFDCEQRASSLRQLQWQIEAIGQGKVYREFEDLGVAVEEQTLLKWHRQYPALEWYDRAFDKVLEAVKTTTVVGNRPAIWYVYNMGIVVKTSTVTFSIDLCHRKAPLLVPYLDFALISHNHGDHYTDAFVKAMRKFKKPIRSNFILDWDNYTHAETDEKQYGEVRVRTTAADHNIHLPMAVLCFECTIGEGAGKYVLYHSGDSCREDQFRPMTARPDLYLGHCAIGLDFRRAYRTTMPAKLMMPLHHQELGHLGGPWRCVGFHEEPEEIVSTLRAEGANCAMPVWGDRIV